MRTFDPQRPQIMRSWAPRDRKWFSQDGLLHHLPWKTVKPRKAQGSPKVSPSGHLLVAFEVRVFPFGVMFEERILSLGPATLQLCAEQSGTRQGLFGLRFHA